MQTGKTKTECANAKRSSTKMQPKNMKSNKESGQRRENRSGTAHPCRRTPVLHISQGTAEQAGKQQRHYQIGSNPQVGSWTPSAFATSASSYLGVCNRWSDYGPTSRYCLYSVFRGLLRHLARVCHIEDFSHLVPRIAPPVPRPNVVSAKVKEGLLAGASASLRCWLLLCSDLAIRSGTAAMLVPPNYSKEEGLLHFITKKEARMTMPVTSALAALLDLCVDPSRTFVAQLAGQSKLTSGCLRRQMKRRLTEMGVSEDVRPHDLRRTTAVRSYEVTRGVRIVQAILGHKNLAAVRDFVPDSSLCL